MATFFLWGPIQPQILPIWKKHYAKVSPTEFIDFVKASVEAHHEVLEIGAGSGYFGDFGVRGKAKRLVGVDPDSRVLYNPDLDQGIVGRGEELPFSHETFDVIFHRMLVEHLPVPSLLSQEVFRVLKPGGRLFVHTPNKWHYSMVVARVTPHWFHKWYMRFLGTREKSEDVHPTYYHQNTKRDILKQNKAVGLKVEHLYYVKSPPGYLRFSRWAFLLGVLYERFIERRIPFLRPSIIYVCRKPH